MATSERTHARLARMRRVVGIVLLVVVGFGAVWCADGCVDPMMAQPNAPLESGGASSCVVCVVPFTTTTMFSLPEQSAVLQASADTPVAHLYMAPAFSIDHPPRFL